MAVFSTPNRKNLPYDKQSSNITRALEKTFKTAIMTSCYPRSQIDIYVEVLEADGSNFAVCVNAATLALVNAGIAMSDIVCASTAAELPHSNKDGSVSVIDTNDLEEKSSMVIMAYLPKLGKLAHLDFVGRTLEDPFDPLLVAVQQGCRDVHSILEAAIREHVGRLSSSLQSTS